MKEFFKLLCIEGLSNEEGLKELEDIIAAVPTEESNTKLIGTQDMFPVEREVIAGARQHGRLLLTKL